MRCRKFSPTKSVQIGHSDGPKPLCWVYLNLPEFILIYLDLPKYAWIYLNLPEFTQMYLTLLQFSWVYLNLPEFIWIYLNIPEFTWIEGYEDIRWRIWNVSNTHWQTIHRVSRVSIGSINKICWIKIFWSNFFESFFSSDFDKEGLF